MDVRADEVFRVLLEHVVDLVEKVISVGRELFSTLLTSTGITGDVIGATGMICETLVLLIMVSRIPELLV